MSFGALQAIEVFEIPLQEVKVGPSPRIGPPDEKHSARLADNISNLPPILVHRPTMTVVDGIHRIAAALMRGERSVRVCFFDGSDEDAFVESVRRNITHGRPLSMAERERATETILATRADWSDRRIAVICGLSPMTVGRVRQRATVDTGQLASRIGRDGKRRPTDPAGQRHRVADALRTNPKASNRHISEVTGASQGTVRDVRTRMQRGDDVLSPRLAAAQQRCVTPTAPAAPEVSGRLDPDFAAWLETRRLESEVEWQRWIDDIPIGLVYELADQARRCASGWTEFANALEYRARKHRSNRGRR